MCVASKEIEQSHPATAGERLVVNRFGSRGHAGAAFIGQNPKTLAPEIACVATGTVLVVRGTSSDIISIDTMVTFQETHIVDKILFDDGTPLPLTELIGCEFALHVPASQLPLEDRGPVRVEDAETVTREAATPDKGRNRLRDAVRAVRAFILAVI